MTEPMRWLLSLLVTMWCATATAQAVSEPHVVAARTAVPGNALAPSESPAEASRQWYGWQNLAVSVPSLALTVGGLRAKQRSMAMVGAAGFVLGSPIVHWAHKRPGTGFLSLGMQVLIPAATGGVGVYLSGEGDDAAARNLTGFLIGACVGALASLAIDAFVLAFDGESPASSSLNFAAMGDGQRSALAPRHP